MNPVSMHRRRFIKAIGATVVLIHLPVYQSCQSKITQESILSETEQLTLQKVLDILFPPEPQTPSTSQINSPEHINRYLNDPNIDPDEQQFVMDGLQWLDETATEKHQKKFLALSPANQIEIISIIQKESWGASWLSKLLTLTFESLLLDPIYKVNIREIGWQWLHHQPGLPRPVKQNAYPIILERKNTNEIITGLNLL